VAIGRSAFVEGDLAAGRLVAAALREFGSSSALVCTSGGPGAVHTYTAAGFERLPERTDRYRDA
jgi:hypothetical protein